MRRVRVTAAMVAAAAALAACGGETESGGAAQGASAAASGAASTGSTKGTEVPEELQFDAKTLDGKDFSGASLAGKPSVLWFWAPWCPKCANEAPGVKAAAEKHGGLTFVGVAARDEVPSMKDFVAKHELGDFTHLADTDSAVWRKFEVTAQPAFAFISADGEVEVVKQPLSEKDLTERLDELAG